MADLERFESDLTAIILAHHVDWHVGGHMPDELAAKIMQFLWVVKDCHEADADVELRVAPHPPRFTANQRISTKTVAPHDFELAANLLAGMVCAACGVHVAQHDAGARPEPPKIEALPATEDWCACGWSDEPHLRSDHEPTLTPLED